jgi:hypothetical protein
MGADSAVAWSPGSPQGNGRPETAAKFSVGPAGRQPDDAYEPRVASVHLAFDRLTDPAARQLPAFEAQAGRWEELRWSLERIRHRFGEGRLWRAELARSTASLPEHRARLAELDA